MFKIISSIRAANLRFRRLEDILLFAHYREWRCIGRCKLYFNAFALRVGRAPLSRACASGACRSRPANLRAKFVRLRSSITGRRWQCRRRKIEESKASKEASLCREERLERSLMGISKVTPTFRWRLFMLSRCLRVLSHSSVTFTQSRHPRGFKGKAVAISFINPAALNLSAYIRRNLVHVYYSSN